MIHWKNHPFMKDTEDSQPQRWQSHESYGGSVVKLWCHILVVLQRNGCNTMTLIRDLWWVLLPCLQEEKILSLQVCIPWKVIYCRGQRESHTYTQIMDPLCGSVWLMGCTWHLWSPYQGICSVAHTHKQLHADQLCHVPFSLWKTNIPFLVHFQENFPWTSLKQGWHTHNYSVCLHVMAHNIWHAFCKALTDDGLLHFIDGGSFHSLQYWECSFLVKRCYNQKF